MKRPRKRAQSVAVIDIGSNSVRLVVYQAMARSLVTVFNEKALCGLGREVQSTGLLATIAWCLPLMIAPPMFSRDGWSYAAQGELADEFVVPVGVLLGRVQRVAQCARRDQETQAQHGGQGFRERADVEHPPGVVAEQIDPRVAGQLAEVRLRRPAGPAR